MGMYDNLRCDAPLPEIGVVEGAVWQTKDGPGLFGTCVITAAGRFMVPVSTRSQGPEPMADAEFHGDVNFYRGGGPEPWEEYRARFTEGQLVRIERETEPRW